MCTSRRTDRSASPPELGGKDDAYLVRDFLRTRHSFVDALATPSDPPAGAAPQPSRDDTAGDCLYLSQAADRRAALEPKMGE
jgi:hypothetical protein